LADAGASAERVIDRIAGHLGDPALAGALHRLEHAGAIDWLHVAEADLGRRRFRTVTEGGRRLLIALPRSARLSDGALLEVRDDMAIAVRVGAPEWLELEPADPAAALELGYAAGNLHWRVAFDGGRMRVAVQNGAREDYLDRLRPLAGRFRVIS
jgi:urease accessory protein